MSRSDASYSPSRDNPKLGAHRVAGLLRSLKAQGGVVEVHLQETGGPFLSAVLGVDGDARRLTLDELTPRRGHDRVKIGTVLGVHGRVNGVPLDFRSQVSRVAEEGGTAFYDLPFPRSVEYRQRRDNYRVPVPGAQGLGIVLEPDGHPPINCRIHDLSNEGCAFWMPPKSTLGADDPERAELACFLVIPEVDPVHCRIDLRHRTRRGTGYTLVGGAFNGIDARDAVRLRKLVVDLQRENLRR